MTLSINIDGITENSIKAKYPKQIASKILIATKDINQLSTKQGKEEKEKRLNCGKEWEGSNNFEENFVFTQWNGKVMHPSKPSKWFNDFLKRKGLKKDYISSVTTYISYHANQYRIKYKSIIRKTGTF